MLFIGICGASGSGKSTLAEELATIEYYGGLHGREKMVAACDEACRVAVRIMRKYLEEQK